MARQLERVGAECAEADAAVKRAERARGRQVLEDAQTDARRAYAAARATHPRPPGLSQQCRPLEEGPRRQAKPVAHRHRRAARAELAAQSPSPRVTRPPCHYSLRRLG